MEERRAGARGPAPDDTPLPAEPTITIISSDGDAFSLRPSTIAHSHLLEGAVRRWTEVYKAALKGRPAASAVGLQNSLADVEDDDDDDDDDATAEDLEETPDENFIARFYDETASDLTAASAAPEDGNGAASAASATATTTAAAAAAPAASTRGDAGDGEDEVGHVTRMVGVPAVGEETGALDDAGDGEGDAGDGRAGGAAVGGSREGLSVGSINDGNDSDRTASVLPSSIERSLSSITSPFKSHSNGDTPTRVGEPGRVVELAAAPLFASVFAQQQPASAAPVSSSSSAGRNTSAAASCSRSTAAALLSPSSRSQHQSPSTRMDADQSTPSVLSDAELEENIDEDDEIGAGGGAAKPRAAPRDPRNLGDEGLLDTASLSGSHPHTPSSPSPVPLTTSTTATAAAVSDRSAPLSNGRAAAARHADPTANHAAATAALPSPSSPKTASGADQPSTMSNSVSERLRSSTVVQATADVDDDDDGFPNSNGFPFGEGSHAAGVAPLSTRASTEAAQGGGTGRHSTSPVPPDWCSPSSCHQRTPCMGDEDDVGAIMSDGAVSPLRTDEACRISNSTAGGGSSPVSRLPAPSSTAHADRMSSTMVTDPPNAIAAPTGGSGTGAAAAAAAAAASDADDAEELRSSVVYADSIRITSSTIVFDLLHPLTPASPRSPLDGGGTAARCAGGSATSIEATPLLTSSADMSSGSALRSATSSLVTPSPSSVLASTTTATVAATSPLHIGSSTLVLCIKYMTHFAEAEAQAAAAAAAVAAAAKGRRHKHRRHHAARHDSDSAATTTSDEDAAGTDSRSSSTSVGTTLESSDSDDDGSTVSDASFNPTIIDVPTEAVGSLGPAQAATNANAAAAGADGGAGAATLGGPSAIAAPLPAPLVAFLCPWERTFLYVDILRAPEAVLTASLAILDVCPGFDYGSPSLSLGSAKVKAALMAPPPPPEGVHALMEVMAAAKQLEIEPLHALCAGWLADYMIRVSYGATDNFEAAHLIRQCLRVPSDWSRRETDCLKIENEWPANEDAE